MVAPIKPTEEPAQSVSTALPCSPDALGREFTSVDATLIALSALTAAALLYAAFSLRALLPPAVQWQRLQIPGYTINGKVLESPKTSRQFAHGNVIGLEVLPGPQPAEGSVPVGAFTVTLAAVGSRSHETFYLGRIREFATAFAIQEPTPAVPLNSEQKKSKFDTGQIEGKPLAQACITRTGLVSADTAQLTADISSWQATGGAARFGQLLGTAEPIPWDCVLVSIRATDEAQESDRKVEALYAFWQQFIEAWASSKPWVQAAAPTGR